MRRYIKLTPLTAEERLFSEENYFVLESYLQASGLGEDDYDIAYLGYLHAVKKWYSCPELRKWTFRTILRQTIRSHLGNEKRREDKRIQTISLNELIPGTDTLTYADTITYENLLYVNYERDEDMNIKYNVALPERKVFRGGGKSDEVLAIESFIVGKMKNMCFEYEKAEEAKKKLSCIQAYRRKQEHKNLYDVYRVDNCIYIVRMVTSK